jgi:acyl-CoA synthetase (AMP-forming)/AMP-acid ligase II
VTFGYHNNPTANEANWFADGHWFRTGDQGIMQDGYLTLTGRIKELINRGGEKISPLELDAVLLEHPNVSDGVAFACPSSKYGQNVAVAVVRTSIPSQTACAMRTMRKRLT